MEQSSFPTNQTRELMSYRKVTNCRICNSTDLFSYLELPDSPLCNNLSDVPWAEQDLYELKMLLCKNCFLSQLSVVVKPEVLYSNYAYKSSTSQTFKDHCYKMAVDIQSQFKLPDNPLVLDIASNDGCLLREFKRAGFTRLIGFEPAKNIANHETYKLDELICVVNDFFSEETAKLVKGDDGGGRASVITATNVFAHVDDLHDFLRGVKWFLHEEGIFVVEVPYLPNLMKNNQFDTVYHEHLSYFLLKPLLRLFEEHGLPIFKVEEYSIHGGSIRLYASKNYYQEDRSVSELLEFEDVSGFYKVDTYIDFAARTLRVAADLQIIMNFVKNSGKKVMGYGASAKCISLINYLGLGDSIHSIVDDTPGKQGKFTPNSNLPIVDFSHFEKEKPDYILLTAWNFASEMMAKTGHLGTKYIMPIPEPRII